METRVRYQATPLGFVVDRQVLEQVTGPAVFPCRCRSTDALYSLSHLFPMLRLTFEVVFIYLFIYSFIHVRDVLISQMHSVQVTVFSHSVTVHQPTTTAGQSHTIRGRQSDRRLSESRCRHPLFIFIKL